MLCNIFINKYKLWTFLGCVYLIYILPLNYYNKHINYGIVVYLIIHIIEALHTRL